MVTAPVAPLTLMPLPATLEVTPLLVKEVAVPEKEQEMPEEQELVVVATPDHTPFWNVSTWPGVAANKDVVDSAVGAAAPPVTLAMIVLAAWVAS